MATNSFDIAGKKIWVAATKEWPAPPLSAACPKSPATPHRRPSHSRPPPPGSRRTLGNGNQPDVVFLAAAKVGGIWANSTYPAQFIYENLIIESNVIHASYLAGVKKLVFLGSSCIYPRMAPRR